MELAFGRLKTAHLHLHVALAGRGPVVLFVHGWPEFWLSWRHILEPVARAGFTAVAMDMRGFNLSDAPPNVTDYAMQHLVDDVVDLLDALGEQHATLVGHDLGARVVWQTALLHPERVRAVAGLSLWHRAPGLMPPSKEFLRLGQGRFDYALNIMRHADIEERAARDVRGLLRSVVAASAFDLSFWEEVEDAYVDSFQSAGMRCMYLHKNLDADWRLARQRSNHVVHQPSLVLLGAHDPVLPPQAALGSQAVLPRAEYAVLDHCGHWLAQEQPDAVLQHLVPFLRKYGRG